MVSHPLYLYSKLRDGVSAFTQALFPLLLSLELKQREPTQCGPQFVHPGHFFWA